MQGNINEKNNNIFENSNEETKEDSNFSSLLSIVLTNAELPQRISLKIQEGIAANPLFIIDLFSILQDDPYLWILVDKEHSLSQNYEPEDLVELTNRSYRVNRAGMLLRRAAEESLEEMAAAARSEGITLTASSAYRSYNYQVQVYERNVREEGQEEADRVSARPGHSQHQLGLVVDFGSITDAFAQTAEGRWIAANASRFGWSLSYPNGYEEITGYRWESWHYRYTGVVLAEFIDAYFDGIQHYALKFLHEYHKESIKQGTQ
ncbi:MAG: M15 family metallopeptidase [Treponema sp.]|nr:M15 family metallopeptidase [Treponema sp.]